MINRALFVSFAVVLSAFSMFAVRQSAMADPVNVLVRISCGGDAAVGSFVADTDFSSGQAYSGQDNIDLTAAGTTAAPMAVYQHQRFGDDFVYEIGASTPPAGKTYTVRLHFVELYESSAGARPENVAINGNKVLADFDAFSAAGGKFKAVVKDFTGIVPGKNQAIDIEFTGEAGKVDTNAAISGIEILADGFAPSPAKVLVKAYAFQNPSLTIAQRVDDMIGQMSLSEKVGQLKNTAVGIARLGIPGYDYWSEGLHGIAREGIATVFPQAIAMGATWDTDLIHSEGDVVGTEARAKFNVDGQGASHGTFHGLTIWSPNINIFRDPRWGRGQETYGEDPYLTARAGVNFIEGMQGDDPKYLKAVACAKHFAVHSGPEKLRHRFDATSPERDVYETYLPQFEAAVREAHVGQVMSAYNAIDGVPAPANKWLLTDTLRDKWGFDGYVVSDCDAVSDVADGHHYAPDKETASADSLIAGTDLNCGGTYGALLSAVRDGKVTEAQIDTALTRVLTIRFRLGLFDPPTYVYAKIPPSQNDTPAHAALALRAAREAIVLLKNNGTLPLQAAKYKRIAVIGANADNVGTLLGNYNGDPSHPVTILKGIQDVASAAGIAVDTANGCPLAVRSTDSFGPDSPDFQKAVDLAKSDDLTIYVGGISPRLEGEEMNVPYVGFDGGDRTTIELPDVQEKFVEALAATGKPVVFVNCSGSAIAMPWEADHLPAIVQAWYPGQSGGTAVGEVLFGKVNPSGRLPITIYRATSDLPDLTDYSMANRTYRYFTGQALFPFGFGLSYTKFDYGKLSLSTKTVRPEGTFTVKVPVTNTGGADGDEVVQAYVKHPESSVSQPIHSLCAFARVHVRKGATATATLTINTREFRYWDTSTKSYVISPGAYTIQIGASSTDIRQTGTVAVTP